MAKKAMILKQQKAQKFSTREYNRCKICGRPHAYLRKYGICRICEDKRGGVRRSCICCTHEWSTSVPSAA